MSAEQSPSQSPAPDRDIIDLTMSYLVAPHVLSKMQYIPEPVDYVTYKERIMGLMDAVFVAGAMAAPDDPKPPTDVPQSIVSLCTEFIRECNDYFRQSDRHRAVSHESGEPMSIPVLPAMSLDAQLALLHIKDHT